MNPHEEASEHLRVIRNLMERATVYRMISAPTALAGGVATLVAAGWSGFHRPGTPGEALVPWFLVLAVTVSVNVVLVVRDARRRGAPLVTPPMRHGLMAVGPAMVGGFLLGTLSLFQGAFPAPAIWGLFYGIGLLATRGYSPRSMQVLGWVFFLVNMVALFVYSAAPAMASDQGEAVWMALTFGLFHLVYGLVVGLKTRFRLSEETPLP